MTNTLIFYLFARRAVLAVLALGLSSLPLSAQLTQVSPHNFEYQRVWRVDNQTALVSGKIESLGNIGYIGLRKVNLQSGAVIEEYFNHPFEPIRKAGHFFVLHDGKLSWWNTGELVQLSGPDWGKVREVFEPLPDYMPQRFAFSTDEALVIWDADTEEVHLIPMHEAPLGWTYADGQLWCYTDLLMREINPENLQPLISDAFPVDLHPIKGAALGPYVLLSSYNEPQEEYVKVWRYDAVNYMSTSLVGPDGDEAFIPSAASEARVIGDEIYLFGSTSSTNATVTTIARNEMRLAKVQALAMTAEVAPAYSDMRMHWPSSPLIAKAELGAVAFGLFGPQGAEPYQFDGGELQALRDIYAGSGSSMRNAFYNGFFTEIREKDGKVYFPAIHAQLGLEVWVSDGSAEGTRPYTDLREGAAGALEIYFAESSTGQLFLQYENNEGSFIYAMNAQHAGISVPQEDTKIWERGFTAPHTIAISAPRKENFMPRVANDGSVGIMQEVSMHPIAWMGANLDWLVPDRTEHPTLVDAFYFVLNEDGSLKYDVSLSHGMFSDVVINREAETGATAMVFKSSERFVINGMEVNTSFDNTTVLTLNPEGALDWWQGYAWGNNVDILDIVYENQNIYLLGSYWHSMTWNGVQQPVATQGERRAFIAQLDADGIQGWLRLLPRSIGNAVPGRAYLTYDHENGSLYAAIGGGKDTDFEICGPDLPVNGSEAQIASVNATSGDLRWFTDIKASQMIKLSGLVQLRNGSLWLGGYTYGSLEVQDLTLALQHNHLQCPANSFLAAFDVNSGALLSLQRDAPEEGKLLQSLVAAENGFYTLSYLLAEENIYEHPLHQYGGRAAMMLDTRDAAGRLLDSELIPIAANSDQSVHHFLNSLGLSMAAHPSEGLYISGHNHFSGSLGLVGARPASGSNIRSYVMQRRAAPSIPALEVEPAFAESGMLHMYPNPLEGSTMVIHVPVHEADAFRQIAVYDVQGKRVVQRSIQPGSQQYLIDLSGLGNGFYLVRMEGDVMRTGKLLINR